MDRGVGKETEFRGFTTEHTSDGTYERFETITVSAIHGTEQTFMCVATGDSLDGTSTVEITILPPTGKHSNLGLIIGLTICVPVAIVILFLLVGKYLQHKHPDYLPRKGCGWNPCWRRPNLLEIFHEEEEELMLEPSSLTKEQVQQCKEDLKEYYRVSRRKVTVDPLNFMERVELDKIYTNISIIDLNSKHKTPITYDDLLTNDENRNLSKRLLYKGFTLRESTSGPNSSATWRGGDVRRYHVEDASIHGTSSGQRATLSQHSLQRCDCARQKGVGRWVCVVPHSVSAPCIDLGAAPTSHRAATTGGRWLKTIWWFTWTSTKTYCRRRRRKKTG
ncbi:uncharacterized protein [Diadema antillarum]|uniref:uncharacterized protein n=1 Tax=Diadema antillarum TaxID=105358 RepID=UPI003A85981D